MLQSNWAGIGSQVSQILQAMLLKPCCGSIFAPNSILNDVETRIFPQAILVEIASPTSLVDCKLLEGSNISIIYIAPTQASTGMEIHIFAK